MSKKQYKIALGSLYKKRMIAVDDSGIKLLEQTGPKSAPTPKVITVT